MEISLISKNALASTRGVDVSRDLSGWVVSIRTYAGGYVTMADRDGKTINFPTMQDAARAIAEAEVVS